MTRSSSAFTRKMRSAWFWLQLFRVWLAFRAGMFVFSTPRIFNRLCLSSLRWNKRKNKSVLMKVLIPSTIKQSGYCRGHPVIKVGERKIQVAREIRSRISLIRASCSSGNFSRSAQTEFALRCYECQGIGHFGRECPTRLRHENQNAPGNKNPSRRSRRSHSPGEKPTHGPKREGAEKNRDKGNE